MTTDYNVIADLGRITPDSVDLDRLADYHAVLGASPLNDHVELIVTLPAASLRQAVSTALTVIEAQLGFEPFIVRAMPTAAFDQGFDVLDATRAISASEAAALLGVTASAVRQRLATGSLAGGRDGRDWRVSARLANLYDGDGQRVARLVVPAGQEIVYEGTRYAPTGTGHSVGANPVAYTYTPVTCS
ncbi:helix-turn-helix domain-containing protein [Actinotalea subterranea]|uniref:helix-turn-helix domain-containing protein n=1 Tax=Actinotalea subterranea TaxID=2607497 RepID=UPI0011EC0176|nr:helix-turn-helix domain-containing protein [Actinotalea subterranea]